MLNILQTLFKKTNNKDEKIIPADNIELFVRVEQVVNEDIGRFINYHGGKIKIIKLENNKLFVNLSGACKGCSAILLTQKGLIERILRDKVPEISEVILIN